MHFHVVADHHKCPSPVELTVTEKSMSLSGESYTITDPEGNVVFKMDGHALSIRDKCVLEDHHGHAILVARKKLRSMHERWEACKGEHFDDDKLLFSVKKSSMVSFKTHLEIFLQGNENDDAPDFEVKGNFFQREAQIFHKDQLIAEVKRKYTVGNVLLDKHTFSVVVFPNVDQAFVAALVIIMDRIHED
ncbi:hypothetical protein GOP47_0008577 [Adiantum capillus-veneris]|uniref:Uncharacterized protein n=1 Tax=Adiantum capillus-veneris TaxID=13818 RepID=A0A9D4V038_ADICA|nr:hypothetical protein GOP47_0008577 [Adiantum capillus-veneris]